MVLTICPLVWFGHDSYILSKNQFQTEFEADHKKHEGLSRLENRKISEASNIRELHQ